MDFDLMTIVSGCALCRMRAGAAPEHEETRGPIPVTFSRPSWWPARQAA